MDDHQRRGEVTRQLVQAARGDSAAHDLVWESLYSELHRLARLRLRGEAVGHTLSTTELVHEAYIKLVDGDATPASNRRHFMALAARVMRQILVDHARHRLRAKRGGSAIRVTLEEDRVGAVHPDHDPEAFLALHDALTRLSQVHPRLGKVVELRYFGGMATTDIAEYLGRSRRTVERDWARARAYLHRDLAGEARA